MMKNKEEKKVKTILLMRHGKSNWEEDVSDFDRPLTARGKNDSPLMGKFLLKCKKTPFLIISSSAKRAKETAELLAKPCRYRKKIELNITDKDRISLMCAFGKQELLYSIMPHHC